MTSPQVARVVVVDDEAVIRGLIALACERHPRLELAAQAANGADALASVDREHPDVVVLDLNLPDLDGLEVAKRLRSSGFTGGILVLTGRADPRTLFRARAAGVEGFVEKTGAIGRVGELIAAIADGERLFSEDQERVVRAELREEVVRARKAARASASLTARERSVLRLLAEGLTTRQAARRLGLSERTVETHIGKLFRKLAVDGRVEAVSVAASLGLLDPTE